MSIHVELFKVKYHTRETLRKMKKAELIELIIEQEGKIRYLMNPDDDS